MTSTSAVPPKALGAAMRALIDEGAGPGSSLHSWRCEYPDRYGPCDCVEETAREVAAAVVAALDLPGRDRETAAKAWDEGVVRGLQTADWEYGAKTNMPDQTNPYGAADLRKEAGQ